MSTVCIQQVDGDLCSAVARVLEPFGGAKGILAGKDEVAIKINAVEIKQHCHTPPDIIEVLVTHLKEHGARRIYVVDNCTQGNFTRLVFYATGIAGAARRAGATPIYLDECREEPIDLVASYSARQQADPYEQQVIHLPAFIVEKLIAKRDSVAYINVPKLKTHSMTTVTLGIKNQWGYVAQADRIADHNYLLHRKFVDILELIRPDITLIDAREATQFGHYPSKALIDRHLVPYGLLVAGDDVVSTDAVGAWLMGLQWQDVEHIKLAHERGLGIADLDQVELVGSDPPSYQRHLSWQLLPIFPPDVDLHRGEQRCCKEGCGTNVLACLQVFYLDFQGKGGFSVVMGKGWDRARLERLRQRVLVVGTCAVEEVGELLRSMRTVDEVAFSHGCNNLTDTITHLLRWMKIPPLRLVPVSPLTSALLLAHAKLRGTTARIPPLWLR